MQINNSGYRNEYLLKICVLGSNDTQKTKIIRNYTEDKFELNYLPTLGVDITTKRIKINGRRVKLIIVDTAGQEFFGKLRPNYYRGTSGALIFCDLYDRLSIENIPMWLKEFKKYIPSQRIPISIVVVINQKEKTHNTSTKSFRLKRSKKRKTLLQIIKQIQSPIKKKAKQRKTIDRNKEPFKTNGEWLTLSNSELISFFVSKYELGICEVDKKNAPEIKKCFSQLAKQIIQP